MKTSKMRVYGLLLTTAAFLAIGVASEALADCTATARFTDNAGRNRYASGPVSFGSGPDLSIDIFTTGTRFFHLDIENTMVTITYSGFSTCPFASGWEKLALEGFNCGTITSVSVSSSNVANIGPLTFTGDGFVLDITSTCWTPDSVIVLDYSWEPAVPTIASTWGRLKALYR